VPEVAGLPAALADKVPPGKGARAWICRGTTCLPPVDGVAALTAALRSPPPAAAG
jgi:uncharacterized protein YyaL (SSP411 family)